MTRALFAALLFVQAALAAAPDGALADPRLEARARALGKELRCPVCQSQSIAESDAPLAHDLRLVVRQRLLRGDSDEQVKDFLVARYGTYVLLKPPLEPATYLLWYGPLLLLAAGGAGAFIFYRRRGPAPPPLSTEETERLNTLEKGG